VKSDQTEIALRDELNYVLEIAKDEWKRSLHYSQAIIPLYVEVILLIILGDDLISGNLTLIFSIGMINIGLVTIFNLKSNIFSLASTGYIFIGFYLEEELDLRKGYCHYLINQNRKFMERYVFRKKRWNLYKHSSENVLRTALYSPRQTGIVLTTALSSLQIGIIILILLRFSNVLEIIPFEFQILFALEIFILSMLIYALFIWQATLIFWKGTEMWHFDILKIILPDFYGKNHIFDQARMSETELSNKYREILKKTNRVSNGRQNIFRRKKKNSK